MLFCDRCSEGDERCLCVDAHGRARFPANWQRLVGHQPNPEAIAQGIQKAASAPQTRRAWETAIESGAIDTSRWKRPQAQRRASTRKATAAPERNVLKLLQDAAPLLHAHLWRNNVGTLQDRHGRYVTFGLEVGSSDLIGYQTLTITPDMVGQQIAVFLAVEGKREAGGVVSSRQGRFIDRVKIAGGRAGVARSVEDLQRILQGTP